MVNDSFVKPSFRPKYYSEYSMGQLDFERFDFWIKEADRWGAIIDSKDVPDLTDIQGYFSAIMALWRNWRALIAIKTIQEDYLKKIDEARKMKRIWESAEEMGQPKNKQLALRLADLLGDIHTKLMETKQVIGLGIAVKKYMSVQERIKRGIKGGKDDLRDLPEA